LMGVDEATTDDGGGGADVGGTVEVAGVLVDVTAEGLGGMLLFTTLLLLRALVVLAVAAAGGVDVVDVVDFVVVCCEAEDALLLEAD
jgi:hypothetical protein